jgi:hypothetical protein
LVDIKQGYYHVPLRVSAREKTLFSGGVMWGKLHSQVLPHGLKHGGQVFQKVMEKVLKGILYKICLVHINDIFIFRKSFEEMCLNLDNVLGRIGVEGGSIDLCRSRFLAKEVDFLGHKVGDIGVAP